MHFPNKYYFHLYQNGAIAQIVVNLLIKKISLLSIKKKIFNQNVFRLLSPDRMFLLVHETFRNMFFKITTRCFKIAF